MNIYDLIFYLFAIITLVSAVFVVTSKNIVHSAFNLLFTFFGVAGIYALLGADFIAVVQLLVYVGGILILLLFGVMLTNKITNVDLRTGTIHIVPAAIGVGMLWGALSAIAYKTNWIKIDSPIPNSTAPFLGRMLITDYVLVFELLGILLLIALIGAASIARREKE
ncbi:MAG: NADH-quinone oxidoreductase subunit J [Ignavibacteriales bacterium CG_4_9_14_3_um_filter_34_10]|nr:MAG: NADH-quinone oxidoreductase subunit J [Ignavibacteriales bacterium CG_4_9_14_3_um_filter_34_10]